MSAAPAVIGSPALAGTWHVDPTHSSVEFRARHAGVARVRGVFEVFDGALEIGPDGAVRARGTLDAASLSTRLSARDNHLRSSDFLDVANHPRIEFASDRVRVDEDGSVTMQGTLTIRGVTREITLQGELHGPGRDDEGAERLGLALEGRLDRRDYGLTWNAAVEGGGLLVGNRVDLVLEFSTVR
jgi:polyisoprenoid-binding protein YceI